MKNIFHAGYVTLHTDTCCTNCGKQFKQGHSVLSITTEDNATILLCASCFALHVDGNMPKLVAMVREYKNGNGDKEAIRKALWAISPWEPKPTDEQLEYLLDDIDEDDDDVLDEDENYLAGEEYFYECDCLRCRMTRLLVGRDD